MKLAAVLLAAAIAGAGVSAARSENAASVLMFGGNAQHTSLFEPAAAPLEGIRWSSTIDLIGTFRNTHYGTPLVTAGNTVIMPVKTATDGFFVEARDGWTGELRYAPLDSDYALPQHNWILPFGPTLATHQEEGQTITRLYFAGAGGTLLFVDRPDGPAGPVTRRAFYGLAAWEGNAGGFGGTVFINTPLTADRQGNVYFGFRVQGTAPAPLNTTQSGIARVAPDGSGRFVLASAAAGGDALIGRTTHNAAPALSLDESTLYVVVKSPTSNVYGYLVGLDAATLAMKHRVFLRDPRNNRTNAASLSDDSTASPMVAPDGDVYFGVQGNPGNGSRGFLLRFSADLAVEKTPGGFGWDSTPAIVPASMVPSYRGPSSYLLFTKYNNYAFADGDGVNRMALLDPAGTQIDPHTSAGGLVQMREVLTVIGPTPDDTRFSATFPNAVREWCINAAAVNPATRSIFAPNEDGFIYRWDLAANSLAEAVRLTPGFGEPYVPTVIGPDGTVFTLNGGTLFAVGRMGAPSLSLTSSNGDLASGVAGDSVTLTAASAPAGTVAFSTRHFPDQSLNSTTSDLARVTLNGGIASLTTASLPAGTHFITARHETTGATATLVQKVHPHSTTTRLSVAGVGAGGAVTLLARVTASNGGVPTGMVAIDDGERVLAQRPLGSDGTVTTTVTLGPAMRTVTATYVSDPLYAASVGRIDYPDPTPPGRPTGLTATPGPDEGQLTLRWTLNPESDGVVEYEVWRAGPRSSSPFELVAISTTDTFVDAVRKTRPPWRYYLVARDGVGNPSPASATVRVRPR
jgi:hypothetical protein